MKILPDQKCDLSIIIVNYQSQCYLERNLASIYSRVKPQLNCEIIIVNNDAVETLEIIKKELSDIKIVDRKKNVGFGTACNLGATVAKGRFLFFLNPDCEIISQNIPDALNKFKERKDIGIVGSQLIKNDGKIQKWSVGAEISLWNLVKNNAGFSKSQHVWEKQKNIEVDWVSGTAMIIEKKLFEKTGGFDENFFMYFEDMDLCRKIRNFGKKVVYFPEFKVKHFEGGSYKESAFQKRNYYDSQEYFFKKNRPRWEYLVIKLISKVFYV